MDLRSEIDKDAKQFFREGRTIILLFAVPIIVLLVLGGVFGRTTTEISGTTLGLCDLDNSTASGLFLSGIINNTKVLDYSNESVCDSFVRKEVIEGRIPAAIVIPEGFQSGIEKGSSQNLTVYIDNSRTTTSPSIEAFMKAAVQDTGQKIGAQFITSVWTKLDDAGIQLQGLLKDVAQSRNESQRVKARLQETSDSLSSINFSIVNNELNAANFTIDKALASMESAESNLTLIESRFAGYGEELKQNEADLVDINNTLGNASAYIATAKAGLNCSDPLFVAYCFSLDSLNSSVGSAQSSVEQRIEKVRVARADLVEANQTIQDFKRDITSARAGAGDAKNRIENMRQFIRDLETNRENSLATISEVEDSIDQIITKSYDLENIISKAILQIKEITARNPQSVVSPIILSSSKMFGERTFFDFLLPSLLPMILMFVSLFLSSTSLVREKNNGTLERIKLSRVNSLEFSAKKVISITVVLIPEAVLLTLIASVIYGAFSAVDAGTVFFVFETLALLILAFVAIGIVIAIYSESEATAFLASLVVGLPLLFLSGLVFPFEFMPTAIAVVGQASPLTQAVFSLQSVMLYKSAQAIGFGILLLYAIFFTIIAAVSMRRIK